MLSATAFFELSNAPCSLYNRFSRNVRSSYSIGDIVETLVDFCRSHALDPKRTYIWICCLCVNQHRVVEQGEQERSGMLVEPFDFFAEFGERVAGIGHILAMMAPWNDPIYLKRVWCIFELYTAHNMECQVSIIMPPQENQSLQQDIMRDTDDELKIDTLFGVLAKTRVQAAQASVEKDRVAILELVEKSPGFPVLNNHVNELLRGWVRHNVVNTVPMEEDDNNLPNALLCKKVGDLLFYRGEYEGALSLYTRALEIRESILGSGDDLDVATSYNNLGSALYEMGQYDEALVKLEKGLAMRESLYKGGNHQDTATSLYCIGLVLHQQGKAADALTRFHRALEMRNSILGMNHPDTADVCNNIGNVFLSSGDYENALTQYRRALVIRETVLGTDHPATATSYSNVGLALFEGKVDSKMALESYIKALAIRQKALGSDHPDTALLNRKIGNILLSLGNVDEAVEEYRMAISIQESVLGANHPDTALSYNLMGVALKNKGVYEEALLMLQKAHAIHKSVLGLQHSRTADSHTNLGNVLYKQGHYDQALEHHRKALAIRRSVLGICHADTLDSYSNIALLLVEKEDLFGALTMAGKMYIIKLFVSLTKRGRK